MVPNDNITMTLDLDIVLVLRICNLEVISFITGGKYSPIIVFSSYDSESVEKQTGNNPQFLQIQIQHNIQYMNTLERRMPL